MRPSSLRLAVCSAAATLTLLTAAALPVGAEPGSADLDGSARVGTGSGPVLGSSSPLGSTDTASLGGALSFPLAPFGSLGVLEDEVVMDAPDPAITETAVVSITSDRDDPRLEEWTVTSASMSRQIRVQVYRAADPSAPAPMLYLLDGVGSLHPSGWLSHAAVDEFFADEQVTLVMPTGAKATMFTDWIADDPVLSRNKWRTFLTEELPPLLETGTHALPFNGKRGIAGLSMGASGAVGLATQRPDLYSGVAGISGCYSTLSDAGYLMAKMTVETRHGTVENMWGPRSHPAWADNDVLSRAGALTGKSIYLSASTGMARPGELTTTADDDLGTYVSGAVIEQFVYGCTRDLDAALAGMDADVQVDYLPDGLHNWPTFTPQLAPAWAHIRDALY